jgi:hypothetical protein
LIAHWVNDQLHAYFDALVGYFRSSGYFKLRPHLKNVSNIRILVGIDVDKLTQEMNALGSSNDATGSMFVKIIRTKNINLCVDFLTRMGF